MVNILGIETSCDDTSVAIVNDKKEILVNLVHTQIEDHKPYGGVVPEIAARSHIDYLDKLINQSLAESGLTFDDIDAIAVTSGPGLIGGLIVGVMTAKAMAFALSKPLLSINHLEGHSLAARLAANIDFPYLLLLISGGHCQLLSVENVGKYKLLGSTKDDALGEAFDKLAKMLSLGYPGGPVIEQYAKMGNEDRFKLPIPMAGREGCDFSFSGLKTALKILIDKEKAKDKLSMQDKYDICASFQKTVVLVIQNRLSNAFDIYEKYFPNQKRFVVSGGVASNKYIRDKLSIICNQRDYKVFYPPINLCTDNGAMIAWAGIERYNKSIEDDHLTLEPRARWSLEELSS